MVTPYIYNNFSTHILPKKSHLCFSRYMTLGQKDEVCAWVTRGGDDRGWPLLGREKQTRRVGNLHVRAQPTLWKKQTWKAQCSVALGMSQFSRSFSCPLCSSGEQWILPQREEYKTQSLLTISFSLSFFKKMYV